MLLALVLALIQTLPGLETEEVVARVPKSTLQLRFQLDGLQAMDAEQAKWKETLHETGVLLCRIDPPGTALSVVAEPVDAKAPTTVLCRDAFLARVERAKRTTFDSRGIACVQELSKIKEGVTQQYFVAFPVIAGIAFRVQTEGMVMEKKPVLTRAQFEKALGTMRVAIVRRGSWEDSPPAVRDLMDKACRKIPDEQDFLTNEIKQHANDFVPFFVQGEVLRFTRKRAAETIDACTHALELLAKLPKPSAQERYCTMIAEDTLSLAMYDDKKLAEFEAHARNAYDVAVELKRDDAGSLAYNVARGAALTDDATTALKYLRIAIEKDEQLRRSAAEDKDFTSLRPTGEFKKLIEVAPKSK